MIKYLILDPKPGDLTMIRVIKARTGYIIIELIINSLGRSEPSAKHHQIDGKLLKQFLTKHHSQEWCGAGNDSRYSKIKIDKRK